MARKMRTVEDIYDDLTNEKVDEAELVTFSVRGVDYEVDLAPTSAKQFDEALAPFIKAARKSSRSAAGRSTKKPPRVRSEESADIRKWARAHGHKVAPRGRIDESIVKAYKTAKEHSAEVSAPADPVADVSEASHS